MNKSNMRNTAGILLMSALASLILLSCSDEKKEEAARLEQELLQDKLVADSLESIRIADSIAASQQAIEEEPALVEAEPTDLFMPPHPKGAGFTVQVAGCEAREYAEYLVEIYANRGYESFISTVTVNDQLYHRVRTGNFESLAPATSLVAELSDKYSIEPWIDNIEQ